MKRKLDHGPDGRPFSSGKKHCKGNGFLRYKKHLIGLLIVENLHNMKLSVISVKELKGT